MELFEGQERIRQRIVDQANVWTEATARRLQITPEAVLRAVERGWTPEVVDRVTTAAESLQRPPLMFEDLTW